jgi:hypothetical protein
MQCATYCLERDVIYEHDAVYEGEFTP